MKKKILTVSCILLLSAVVCGCSNQQKQSDAPAKIELVEVQNPDYTYSYKDQKGNIIINNVSQRLIFDNGVATIEQNGKFGIIDNTGKYLIEPVYDYMSNFQDGMCAFFIDDLNGNVKIGYYNTKAEIAIEPRPADVKQNSGYTYDYNFYNGIAMYRHPETYKYGFIDKNGDFIVEPIYEWAEPFKGNLAPVTKGDKYGYINKKGDLILPYKYVFADAFSDGLAAVYNGSTWGYIDETGHYVIPSKFGSYEGHDGEEIANPFINGSAAVYLGKGQTYRSDVHKGQFALIDKTGKIINNQKYDSLYLDNFTEPGKPVYIARLGNKFLTLDTKGNILKEEN